MLDIFQYSFMIRAFIAGIMMAIVAPLIGNFLVVRRFSLIADTLSHIALAGVAIGLILHTQTLVTTTIVTILVAVIIEKLRSNRKIPGDALLAMFLPGGLALSIVLISLSGGLNTNLLSYLFGSITTVTVVDLLVMAVLCLATLGLITFFYKKLLFTAFDETSAKVSGIKTERMNLLLAILTAVTVSLSMRVVGVLLIGALMVIPVVTSMQIAKSFSKNILLSVMSALLSVVGGLFISYYLNLPAGGTIVLLALTQFGLVTLFMGKKSYTV